MDSEWKEKARVLGPKHPKGQVCILVSEREPGEYSYAGGFMNGPIFRPQRFFPGNRIEEVLDAFEEATDKFPPGKVVANG